MWNTGLGLTSPCVNLTLCLVSFSKCLFSGSPLQVLFKDAVVLGTGGQMLAVEGCRDVLCEDQGKNVRRGVVRE